MDLPAKGLTVATNIVILLIYSFAIPHHLRTFFSPFKRMAIKNTKPGINLSEIGEVISFNLVSVGIGIILRTFILTFALLIVVITIFLLVPCYLIFLLFCPLISLLNKQSLNRITDLTDQARKTPGPTLYHLLAQTQTGQFLVRKLVLSYTEVKSLATTTAALSLSTTPTSLSDLLYNYAKNFVPFHDLLQGKLLDETDIKRVCQWSDSFHENPIVNLLDRDSITRIQGFGASWSYGYTNELDKYQMGQTLTEFPKVVGRDKEIDLLEKAITKSIQNSCIVIGEPGVGRHAIVDEFARRLFSGNVPASLAGSRTIFIDLKSVISQDPSPAGERKIVLDLFEEGRQAGNVILVIDDIDKYLETSGERLDLNDIFVQTLSDGRLRIIGLTTQQLYDKYISTNSNLLKLFTSLIVNPPDIETVYEEMEESIVPVLEKKDKVEISYSAIKEAIVSADRFVSSVPFPEKSINILDETVTAVKSEHPHMKTLGGQDVQQYLSAKTHIPIGVMNQSEKEKLQNLEPILHQRIIGQDEAISSLAKAVRRSFLNISERNKPLGTFLFLGPTGVGKTETAKTLAEAYFGSESRLVRFDMSEYQGEEGLEKLIGSAKTNPHGQLTSALEDNPFAVLLLDEIEKAPPIILNLFLTLIDEGYLTDASGKKISAKQNIIIGTSNAGGLFIQELITHNATPDDLTTKVIDYVQKENIFSPEFLNRFDGVIVFKPLDESQMKAVARKILAGVAKRLAEKKITVEFSDELVDRIIKEGYNPSFGARSVFRYIQNTVEDDISKKLLSENLAPGSTIKL